MPIGGVLAMNDDELAERARELMVVYEGFPHYGGMAGHDMEALAQGIVESAQEAMVRHVTGQAAYLAGLLEATGVLIVVPPERTASSWTRSASCRTFRRRSSRRRRWPPRSTSRGGVRTMERGIVSGQHGHEPYDGLELVRLAIPRRVYTGAPGLCRRDARERALRGG